MSSTRLPPSTSFFDLSMAAKDTSNNRNNDRRTDLRQERPDVQMAATKKRASFNESRSFDQEHKKRHQSSSLLSSRDNRNTPQQRYDRGHSNAEINKYKNKNAPSLVDSIPETKSPSHPTIDETLSTNNNDSSKSSSTAQTKPDQAAIFSDVGSDLLEFGASVEFHEDHRRHIHAETLEIEASSETTKEAVSKEERAEEQLTKDLGRSKTELKSLNQGIEDQFESAKMFWTLTTNLRRECLSRIVGSTKPTTNVASRSASPTTTSEQNLHPSKSHPVTPDERKKDVSKREGGLWGSQTNEDKDDVYSLSNQDSLAKKESTAEKMLQTLKDEMNSLKTIKNEIEGFKEKQVQLEESMKSQRLQESLNRSKEDERRIHSEILQDRNAKTARLIEIQKVRESCGKKGQMCMDLEKKLSETKKCNAIEEAKLRQQSQKVQIDLGSLRKKKEDTMLQLELEKRNLEKVSKVVDDYHNYCKMKENYKGEKARRNEEKKQLLARHAEAMRRLKEAQEKEEISLLRKQEAQKAFALAEAQKKANSEMEENIVVSGKAELADLSERKMKLAQQIAETSKKAEKDRAKENEIMAAKIQAKNEAIAEAEKMAAEYKGKQEEIEATEEKNRDFIQSHNEEIDSYKSKAVKFAKLRKTESENYERRLKAAEEQWSEKFLRHVEGQEEVFESHAFKLDVIEEGILLLRDVEKVERQARRAG